PVHDLGLRRVQPGLGPAQPATQQGLLRDVGLLLPGVLSRKPVRTRLGGSGHYDRHPGRRDFSICAADGAGCQRGWVMRRRSIRAAYDVIGVLVFVVMLFPIYWMVSTAFK